MPSFEIRKMPSTKIVHAYDIPEGRLATRHGHTYLRTMETLTCLDNVGETFSSIRITRPRSSELAGFKLLPEDTKIVVEIPE